MKNVVAVEIHNKSIRAAEILHPLSKNPKIVKLSSIDLPPNIIGESLVNDSDPFVLKLQEFWKQEGFSTKDVVLAVSGRRFVVRPHETLHTDIKTLKKVLPLEAAPVIPEQMSNPIIDFYPMFHRETKTGIKTHGLVIATPAEPVELLIGSFIKAGLNVKAVDFAPMSIVRFANKYTDTKTYAIVNIREYSSDIVIVHNNIARIVRVVANGLKTSKGGKRARQTSQSINEDIDLVQSPIEVLGREINITIQSQIEELETPIDTVYMVGNRSHDPEALSEFHELLGNNKDIKPLTVPDSLLKTDLNEHAIELNFVAICAGIRNTK